MMNWPPKKLSLTFASFAGIMALTDLIPPLRDYKVMDWTIVSTVADFAERKQSQSPEAEESERLKPDTNPLRQAKFPVLDPTRVMDRFYRALHQAEGKSGVARVLHYGDSPTTADMITSDVRALLQRHFGDASHGFCLIAKPWAWYGHKGLDSQASGWLIDPANQPTIKDGLFGLGAVSFRAGPGARARIRLRDSTHKRIEVAYLQQPDGGQVRITADGQDLGVLRTDGEKRTAFAPFALPPESNEVVFTVLSGPVRLYGVSFEKDSPGLIYDSLGVNGASVTMLAKNMSQAHWRDQLQHTKPDLVIINYGTNESGYPQFIDTVSEQLTREVIQRLREAVPEAAILIMSPMDRGTRQTAGEIGTVPGIPRLVAIQQRVAQATGVAFFNTFEAMGGVGTMGRWYEAEPRLVGADFIHPMPAGARIVGGLLYQALLDGYNKYKLRLIEEKLMASESASTAARK